jgi:shikimate kinase
MMRRNVNHYLPVAVETARDVKAEDLQVMPLPLYLIGARGCGKTTVGQALADALGYAFSDTDRHLQEITQRTVAEIVSTEGWEGFRQRETLSLKAVTAPGTVIATGGGMILAEENRKFMREHGRVIYLHAEASILAARLEAYPEQAQRPTLTGRPIADEMVDVLAARDALYQQAAHYVINAMQTPEGVVEDIITVLSLARAS